MLFLKLVVQFDSKLTLVLQYIKWWTFFMPKNENRFLFSTVNLLPWLMSMILFSKTFQLWSMLNNASNLSHNIWMVNINNEDDWNRYHWKIIKYSYRHSQVKAIESWHKGFYHFQCLFCMGNQKKNESLFIYFSWNWNQYI